MDCCFAFPFTTPDAVLNHVDAITLKRQNGPICEKESHKTLVLASALRLTCAHGHLKSEMWKYKIPLCTFPAKWRCGNIKC